MLVKTPLYEVWCSTGSGMMLGPRFRHLDDAKRHIAEHRHGASMAIRGPDGRWDLIAPRPRQYSSRLIQARRVANTNR
jgi:hypothetical protein